MSCVKKVLVDQIESQVERELSIVSLGFLQQRQAVALVRDRAVCQSPALGHRTGSLPSGAPRGTRRLGEGEAEPRRQGAWKPPAPCQPLLTAPFLLLPS